jgi:hypothetical protein
MLPFQSRNEKEIYRQAVLSGMFPEVEPSNHEALFKQMERRQKLGDFNLMREKRRKFDDYYNARAELDRQTQVMNTRLPHLRGAEARMQQDRRFVDEHHERASQMSDDV